MRDLTAVFFFDELWEWLTRTRKNSAHYPVLNVSISRFCKDDLTLGLEMGCRQSPATAGAAPFSSPADLGPAR